MSAPGPIIFALASTPPIFEEGLEKEPEPVLFCFSRTTSAIRGLLPLSSFLASLNEADVPLLTTAFPSEPILPIVLIVSEVLQCAAGAVGSVGCAELGTGVM